MAEGGVIGPENKGAGTIQLPETPFSLKIKELVESSDPAGPTAITNPSIQRLAKAAMQPRNQTPEGLQQLLQKGDEWFIDGKVPEEEWGVLAGVMAEKQTELALIASKQAIAEPQEQDKIAEQLSRAAQAMEQAARQQKEMTQESTYDIFVNAEWIQAPIRTDFDTFPPSWFRKLTPEGQRLIRARTRLANATFIKRRVGHIDLEAAKNNEFLILTREEAESMYQMPGFKRVIETLFEELFEGETINGRYRLRFRKGAREKLADWESFRNNLRQSLVGRKIVASEIEATAAVAVAWNLLFTGNAIESADHQREAPPGPTYGEQIRANMHPLAKARQKILKDTPETIGTEEGWGGMLGTWLVERVAHDPAFRRQFELGQIKPFPETLLFSMFEDVKLSDGESLAQKILEKKPIDWYDPKMPAELFGSYADIWDTAFKAYLFAAGKKPLDIKSARDWSAEIADIISKMRGDVLKDEYADPDFLFWCICASASLKPYTSIPILELPGNVDYGALLDIILSPRLVDKATKKAIIEKFRAGFGGGIVRRIEDIRRSWRKGL